MNGAECGEVGCHIGPEVGVAHEARQQNELALRVGETIAEMNAKRLADASQFRKTIRETEYKVGAEIVKTRASLNYFLTNASQRQ